MDIASDSNILLRLAEPGHVQHALALHAVVILRVGGHLLCIFPQMLYEFWAVATRPLAANGLGKTAPEIDALIAHIEADFVVLSDDAAILPEWRHLVARHNVLGKKTHDARIAAAMNVHGVTHLLTFNVPDFQRFPSIIALDPHAVAAGTAP
jgi:predicted nucleic acid-binding protein